MSNQDPLTELRLVLASLYPDELSSRVVVADAGLAVEQIVFSAAADTNWFNILQVAQRQELVPALLNAVNRVYGRNSRFARARQTYLAQLDSDEPNRELPGVNQRQRLQTELQEWLRLYHTATKRVEALDQDIGQTLDSEQRQILEERREQRAAARAQAAQKIEELETQLSSYLEATSPANHWRPTSA